MENMQLPIDQMSLSLSAFAFWIQYTLPDILVPMKKSLGGFTVDLAGPQSITNPLAHTAIAFPESLVSFPCFDS